MAFDLDPSRYAVMLATAGWALIGAALGSVVFASLPWRLLQPEFHLRLISAILSGSTAILLGCLLICGAYFLDPESQILRDRANFVRKFSRWFAVLLLLVVPVQLFAGVRAMGQLREGETRLLRQRRQVIQGITNTQDESALRFYIRSLPDRPQMPDRFDAPFPVIKQRVHTNLSEKYKVVEGQIRAGRSQRWERFLGEAARNSVQALLMALGFWTSRPTRKQKEYARMMDSYRLKDG